ncbi:MAG: secondary thiamine-phosphate synthase enzyme YjbQ [Cephaloticoccus sp.]|nr:secondary thiamine-phosphate synthase enzyme YjbQ [Cephaloticoccus sp.]MCF7760585.1 secondary thiamine-phosphate synthase enzyme YjbQ [Cephaloticoccus sp.]
MAVFQHNLMVQSRGADLHEITRELDDILLSSGQVTGVLTVFCQHTSCSLVIMENADPSARRDLVAWLQRLVPENDPEFTHTAEGSDDMPSHIKMALTRTSESIPFAAGRLLLGTWQGVYLWEHRRSAHRRRLVVTVVGE